MKEWWDSLSLLGQIFYSIAIPATTIMVIQSLMMFLGMGFDNDFDADGDVPDDVGDELFDSIDGSGDGLSLITVRGLVAFFAVGGWTGIVVLNSGASEILSVLASVVAGTLALLVVGYLFKLSMKLQDAGNIKTENALGKTARVYIPIPKSKSGSGKVTLVVQERFIELSAMTSSNRQLKTGELVEVVGLVDGQTVLVESIKEEKKDKNEKNEE